MAVLVTILCVYPLLTAVMASLAPAQSATYIIAGAGTTGLLLANRLSRDPKVTVVLIEPGPDERNDSNVTDPLKWQQTQNTPIDWAYKTAPQINVDDRVLTYHSGRIVGGTSMINGMKYVRPDKAEIDAWQSLGATGWTWDNLWPFFTRTERFIAPTEAQVKVGASYVPSFHGEHGDLTVTWPYQLVNGSFFNISAASWDNLEVPINDDPSGGILAGFTVRPMTVDRDANQRESAARAFYYPVEARPNLRIVKGSVVRIVWRARHGKDQVAESVAYVDANEELQHIKVEAKGEVILSAGSLRTPTLLEASGIGNVKRLLNIGIEPVIDLPGVGENLQDQQALALTYLSTVNHSGLSPYATFATASQIFEDDFPSIAMAVEASLPIWAQKTSLGSGLVAKNYEQIFRVQNDLIFNKNVTAAEILTSSSGNKLTSSWWASLPFSRGSVHLRSKELSDISNPIINPHFFQIDFDLQYQIEAGRLAVAFWNQDPVRDLVVRRLAPSYQDLPIDASDAEWSTFLKATCVPNYHPIGTAAMMARDLGGVVDPRLRVYGTRNVRVVDASVMPLQTSGHVTSVLYAIAEKAAEMIAEDDGLVGVKRNEGSYFDPTSEDVLGSKFKEEK